MSLSAKGLIAIPLCYLILNKVVYSVLPHHQYTVINMLVLATCFGIYQTIFRPVFTINYKHPSNTDKKHIHQSAANNLH